MEAAPSHSYTSGKVYNHSVGLSCCFRQWRAKSHCNQLHGYALKVSFEFVALELDDRNWVIDFGDMKEIKAWLTQMFDHTTLVAKDDPLISTFKELHTAKLVDLRVVDNVGCEAMARMIYDHTVTWLTSMHEDARVLLRRVYVHEHDANFASYGLEG